MINNTIVLIIQSMQLTIVALIIIVSLNRTLSNISADDEQAQSFFSKLFRGCIGIGFLCNLVYIFLLIGSTPEVDWFEPVTIRYLLYLFESLTATAFILGSLAGVPKKNAREIYAGFIVFVAMLIIYFNYPSRGFFFYVYNFIAYLLISLYAFRESRWSKGYIKNIYSTKFVAIGFLAWTIIQFWPLVAEIYRVDPAYAGFVGFSISMIGKILILYGFYDYSVKVADYAKDQQQAQLKQIKSLATQIKVISNSKSTDEHAEEVTKHLIEGPVFKFDYAIFSEVDYLSRRVMCKKAKRSSDKIIDVEEWVEKAGIPFDDIDILAKVFREQERVHVVGNRVDGRVVDFSKPNAILKKHVFDKYNHQYLDRFFIPVIKLKEEKNDEEEASKSVNKRVVAIIEIGCSFEGISDYELLDIEKFGQLDIYIDNSCQSYQRLYDEQVRLRTDEVLTGAGHESQDDHLDFLHRIFQHTCEFVKPDESAMSLVYKNKVGLKDETKIHYYNVPERIKEELTVNIIRYVEEKEVDSNSKSQVSFERRVSRLTGLGHLMMPEVALNESVSIFWFFASESSYFFNSIVAGIFEKISNEIKNTYLEKKYHSYSAELVKPNNAITDLEINMQPVIDWLTKFFETPFASIWIKENGSYEQKYASPQLRKLYKGFDDAKISAQSFDPSQNYIIEYPDAAGPFPSFKYGSFITNNKIKTIIHKPLSANGECLGLMSLFFLQKLERARVDETNFLNLLAVKALITLQVHSLVKAFQEISDSLTRNNLDNTLQKITDQAMKVLYADPVILFKSDDGSEVFFRDVTYSKIEDFHDSSIFEMFKDPQAHVGLAELIIKDGTKFFDNYGSYLDYINHYERPYRQSKFKQDFWNREEIASMAAVQLVNKIGKSNTAVGVMFVNFRKQLNFNEETKSIIHTFGAFASEGIANGLIFERNRQFVARNTKMTRPLLMEVIAYGTLHNAHKIFLALHDNFFDIHKEIIAAAHKREKIDPINMKKQLEILEQDVVRLDDQFSKLAQIYLPNTNLIMRKSDLRGIIRARVESLRSDFDDKAIKVNEIYAKGDLTIDCDEGLLGDVILNILTNACYVLKRKGIIDISVGKISDGNEVRIDIADDGPGIAEDIRDKIFEPYATNKPKGSGLGLAISKLTVEQHGGKLTFKSGKGRTVFTIILPVNHDN